MNDRTAILDVGIFIWDEAAFKTDPRIYFEMAGRGNRFLTKFYKEKISVAFSPELQALVYASFPARGLNNGHLQIYRSALLKFLSAVTVILIPAGARDVSSAPDVQRPYFNVPTRTEIERIKTGVMDGGESRFTFFSFLSIWPDGDEIRFQEGAEGANLVRVEVVLADFDTTLNEYFSRNMNVFDETHPKHLGLNTYTLPGGRVVSILSCYKGKNAARCQEVLNHAVSLRKGEGDRLISWDCENCVWVIFDRSIGGELNYRGNNIYHGHDEPNPSEIPDEALRLRARLQETCPC